MTWEECAEAGMTLSEAAKAMGRTPTAGFMYAKRHGVVFRRVRFIPSGWTAELRARQAERIRAQWQDEERRDRVSLKLRLIAEERGQSGNRKLLPFKREDPAYREYKKIRREGGSRDAALRALGFGEDQ